MKNYILVACAVASLYLSFTFQYEKEPVAEQQQEELLPAESLLWTTENNQLSPESYIHDCLALRYEPAAEPTTKVRKPKKKKPVAVFDTKAKKLKSARKFKADSPKLAYMEDPKLQQVAAQ